MIKNFTVLGPVRKVFGVSGKLTQDRKLESKPIQQDFGFRHRAGLENAIHRSQNYLLREQKPEDFVLAQGNDGKYYYSISVTARVLTEDGKPIFTQEREHKQYLDADKFEEVRSKAFAFEGLLPLPPGKYKLEFVLNDRLKHTGFRTEKQVVVPDLPTSGVRLTDLVPFSGSKEVGREHDLAVDRRRGGNHGNARPFRR